MAIGDTKKGNVRETSLSDSSFISLLSKAGCDQNVIDHSVTVTRLSEKIAGKIISKGLLHPDLDLIRTGAMLHDIGRSKTHGMAHSDESYKICKILGFDDKVCNIVWKHIGAGLTAKERHEMGLIETDTIPETLEEKIVANADNYVKGDKILSEEEFLLSLNKLPKEIKKRFLDLAEEISSL